MSLTATNAYGVHCFLGGSPPQVKQTPSKTEISQLETEISQLKTDISQLETDISQLEILPVTHPSIPTLVQ